MFKNKSKMAVVAKAIEQIIALFCAKLKSIIQGHDPTTYMKTILENHQGNLNIPLHDCLRL